MGRRGRRRRREEEGTEIPEHIPTVLGSGASTQFFFFFWCPSRISVNPGVFFFKVPRDKVLLADLKGMLGVHVYLCIPSGGT